MAPIRFPLLVLCSSWLTASLAAQELSFTKIADLSTEVPGDAPTTFDRLTLDDDLGPAIEAGQVAFFAEWIPSGSTLDGAFFWDGSSLVAVAVEDDAIPGGTDTFTVFEGNPSVAEGRVLFAADNLGANEGGAYTGNGGPLTVVYDTTTEVPGVGGTFFDTGFNPGYSHDDGVVYWSVAFTGGEGLFRRDGANAPTRVLRDGDALPAPLAALSQFEGHVAAHEGAVAFVVFDTNGEGAILLERSGAIELLARDGAGAGGTAVPGAGQLTDISSAPLAFDGTFVAVVADTTTLSGGDRALVRLTSSSAELVAGDGDPMPGGDEIERFASAPSIADGDILVVVTTDTSRDCLTLFTIAGPEELVCTGEVLPGESDPVSSLMIGAESFDGSTFAFRADLGSSNEAIFVASSASEIPTATDLGLALTAFLLVGAALLVLRRAG